MLCITIHAASACQSSTINCTITQRIFIQTVRTRKIFSGSFVQDIAKYAFITCLMRNNRMPPRG
jgi:hypothetical protein